MELYKGQAGSPITYLTSDISANQTTISIADDSALPDAPNIATIGYGEQLETIKYETKSNGVLQNVTRGIEGTPRAWPAGTEVARFFTAYDHNSIIENFNSHLADDVSQGKIPHIGLGGSISHATDTGEVTTPHLRQVNASIRGTASAEYTQVNASRDSIASGAYTQVNASRTTTVSGQHSFAVGSLNSEVIGNVSGIICAGRHGFSITGGCTVTADNALVLVGRGVLNDEYGSIAGGLPPSYTQTPSPPSTAERKWHIFSTTGDIQIAGQLTPGHSFTDFAELFPNLTGKKQEYGLLQTIDGFGVRPAQAGERVIGVTSATAGIILGDTPFSWQGRWLKDEWGAYIYETIIDEETGEEITYPKENPEWNPELEQQSRLQRPDEWTVVGLIGQVYVMLKEDVQPMDYVKAWQNGVGQKSLEPTNLQVMKITQEYDAEKGYKIGFCLLR